MSGRLFDDSQVRLPGLGWYEFFFIPVDHPEDQPFVYCDHAFQFSRFPGISSDDGCRALSVAHRLASLSPPCFILVEYTAHDIRDIFSHNPGLFPRPAAMIIKPVIPLLNSQTNG
jgi:hypothetical protein